MRLHAGRDQFTADYAFSLIWQLCNVCALVTNRQPITKKAASNPNATHFGKQFSHCKLTQRILQRFKGFYAAKKMGAALMGGGWKSKGTSPEWCDSAGNLKWHSCCMLHIEELAMNTLNFPLWHTRGLNANAPWFSYPFSQI